MSVDRSEIAAARTQLRVIGQEDPRLFQALTVVKRTVSGNFQDYDHEAVTKQALAVQESVARKLDPLVTATRPPVLGTIKELAGIIAENQGGLIVMRHGIQLVKDEDRRNLQGPAKKIADMQLPHNMSDPADVRSLAEAASFGVVLGKISRDNDIPVQLISSPNVRAAEVAAVMGVPTGFNFLLDDRLRCVNYPNKVSWEALDQVLGRENNGSLVWKKDVIDKIAGDGTYDIITANMKGLVGQFREKNAITVLVTHTPQTNAVDVIANQPTSRMPELGFRLLTRTDSVQFKDNIFGTN